MWIGTSNENDLQKPVQIEYQPRFSAESTASTSGSEHKSSARITTHNNSPQSTIETSDTLEHHFKQSKIRTAPTNSRPHTSAKVWLVLYAAGCLSSGSILAALTATEQNTLLSALSQTFRFPSQSPINCFSVFVLPALLQVSLVLLFGFCVFGSPLIGVLITLSGVFSGFVAFAWLNEHGLPGLIYYIVRIGLYQALLALAVCYLGKRGALMSHKLFAQTFSHNKQKAQAFDLHFAKRFLRCGVITTVFTIFVCGFSTALTLLSAQLIPAG